MAYTNTYDDSNGKRHQTDAISDEVDIFRRHHDVVTQKSAELGEYSWFNVVELHNEAVLDAVDDRFKKKHGNNHFKGIIKPFNGIAGIDLTEIIDSDYSHDDHRLKALNNIGSHDLKSVRF